MTTPHPTLDARVALCAALRRARALYNMPLRMLAPKADVSVSFLSRVENGHERPTERVLRVYAAAFRMDFDELNRLAGRVPNDVVQHLVNTPGAVQRVRAEMKEEEDGKK